MELANGHHRVSRQGMASFNPANEHEDNHCTTDENLPLSDDKDGLKEKIEKTESGEEEDFKTEANSDQLELGT